MRLFVGHIKKGGVGPVKASLWKTIGVLTLLTGAVVWVPILAPAAPENTLDPRQVWMSVGEKRPNETFSQGEPIVLNFETSKKAYVMAVNVSPKGDVMVLFPNGESPENL